MIRRRFKVKDFPEYHQRYNILKQASFILNKNMESFEKMRLCDKQGLTGLLIEWRGTDSRKIWMKENKEIKSRLLEAEERVKELEDRYKRENMRLLNTGHLPFKSIYESSVAKEYLRALAELDIVQEEIDELEKLLKEVIKRTQSETEKKRKKIIPQGFKVGIPTREADGQKVIMGKDGLLVIDEPGSPYNGLPLIAYMELVVKKYHKEKKIPPRPSNQEVKEFLEKSGVLKAVAELKEDIQREEERRRYRI